ncbi:hypothetical protein C8R46DRAFT_1044835 [Mycena filopes]|nr:hypothetical protein C8R46DRAFT_1044835 [Mycena filopes]
MCGAGESARLERDLQITHSEVQPTIVTVSSHSIEGEGNCLPAVCTQATNESAVRELKRQRLTTTPELGSLKDVDPQSSLASPIGRLPTELMGQIFSYFPLFGNPLVLCWVCHYWRVVAMAIGSLWIRPVFSLGSAFFPNDPTADYPGTAATEHVEQMRLWLHRARRSQAVSLSIVRGNNQYRWREIPFLESLIPPYAHCLRSLEIHISQGQLASLLNGCSAFPNLDSLSLRFPVLDFTGWLQHRGFRNMTPRLRNLIIGCGRAISEPHPISTGFLACFPWAQLTSLNMEEVILDFWMWRDVMHQSLSVRTGRFTLRKSSTRDDSHPSVATRLASLHIDFLSQVDIKVFRGFNLPELKCVHIVGYMSEPTERNFVSWAEQHCNNLRRLTLELNICDNKLVELLHCLPNLSTLKLHVDFRVSLLTTEAILTAIQQGHLTALKTLALCCNGATRIYKATRPDMFATYVETLVSAARAWAETAKDRELQIFAEAELLTGLLAQVSSRDTSAAAASVPCPRGGFFVSITGKKSPGEIDIGSSGACIPYGRVHSDGG